VALFAVVPRLSVWRQSQGHDSEMAPQVSESLKTDSEMAIGGFAIFQPTGPIAVAIVARLGYSPTLKFTASEKPPESTPASAIWRRSSGDVSAASSSSYR
jgi:hypothetical protein